MKGYSTREVAEALGLPTSRILAWTRSGLIEPARGPRGAHVFSFQDLVLLRTARELLDSDVPARRIRESLAALRAELPAGRPLSAVSISALGSRVLVQDDDAIWEPGSGQLQITFPEATAPDAEERAPQDTGAEGSAGPGHLTLHRGGVPADVESSETRTADDWYDAGVDLESTDPPGAMAAYRRALVLDETFSDAHLNLGRLLHESGDVEAAESHYRSAIDTSATNARAWFNLGVALEDREAAEEARAAYLESLRIDPALAVAHYNVSRLCEEAGDSATAIHHLSEYRRLVTSIARR